MDTTNLTPEQRDALKDVVPHLVNRTLDFYDELYRYAQGYALDDDTTADLLSDVVVALAHARELQLDLLHPGWRQQRADLLAAVDAVETPADRARWRARFEALHPDDEE